jgi:phosphatidylglycerophosphatase A
MRFRDKAALFLATGCYCGHLPYAPGTFGTLLALPACYGISRLDPLWALAAVAGFIPAAVWIAGRAEALLERKDAPAIVIDEVAGLMVALAGLPFTPPFAAGGFVFFRLFDILKPFPARRIEAGLPGGFGVVLDDVVAGLYANLVLRLAAAAAAGMAS